MGRAMRKSRREKEPEDRQRLLVDLEANTAYHSFPRPTFSERRSSTIGPTKAEKSLRDVLRAYPAPPVDPEEAAEESLAPFTRLQYAFVPPATDVTTEISVDISSPTVRSPLLGPTDTASNSSFWFTSRPNTPVTIYKTAYNSTRAGIEAVWGAGGEADSEGIGNSGRSGIVHRDDGGSGWDFYDWNWRRGDWRAGSRGEDMEVSLWGGGWFWKCMIRSYWWFKFQHSFTCMFNLYGVAKVKTKQNWTGWDWNIGNIFLFARQLANHSTTSTT
ncbi:hypothetical protein L211DRAFT_884250 [Terfezia boudieri ATCC MYA-4762]|uniref:Uncharacterized protein n=1 Tax=Terfezia boudieri ATCC MYA-4762 TaxID=1051890 RepID=A0A3N4LJ53_9PEZI|nr:hypothetical protein L211DRAFT_884250 [Terfezia boudieri ATCC MYA-4762]